MPQNKSSKKGKRKNKKKNSRNLAVSNEQRPATASIAKFRFVKDPLLTGANLEALVNPFAASAKGAKWPDGMGEATLPFQVRTTVTVLTTGVGAQLFYCSADPFFNTLSMASISAGNFTMNSAWNGASFGNLSTFADLTRVVTAGIIVRNITSATNAQGYMVVTRQSRAPAVSAVVATGQQYGTDVHVYPLVSGLEVPIVFRQLGNNARNMSAPSTSTTQKGGAGWDVLKVEFIGAATSSNVATIEIVTNLEFTYPDSQDAIAQLNPVYAPFSRALCDLSDAVGPTVSSLASNTLNNFSRIAFAAVLQAIRSYTRTVVPAGRAQMTDSY